jgi:hypothetical protein
MVVVQVVLVLMVVTIVAVMMVAALAVVVALALCYENTFAGAAAVCSVRPRKSTGRVRRAVIDDEMI